MLSRAVRCRYFFGLFGFCLVLLGGVPCALALTPAQKSFFRSAVCSIQVKSTVAGYEKAGSWSGTGFVCDKKQGLICTNRHVVGYAVVATYDVEFFNGQKSQATLVYADPRHDFAFLKLNDPAELPPQTEELTHFAEPVLGETVFMAGNNQGCAFSFQKGHVSDLYQPWGFMPEPSFGCLINAVGGSSGSPVVNKNLELVGLNFAGFGDGRCLDIRGSCLQEALESLRRERVPQRQCIGALLELASLDTQLEVFQFPFPVAQDYLRHNPHARFRVLQVRGLLKGTPADGLLQVGDVVMAVDGQAVGSCLARYETALNKARKGKVILTIYRKGRLHHLTCPVYDLHPTVVRRMVVFGGATFTEADERLRWQFDLEPGAVVLTNTLPGSIFSGLFLGETSQAILTPFKGLPALWEGILTWQQKKTFAFEGCFLCPTGSGSSEILLYNKAPRMFALTHQTAQSHPPKSFVWDKRGWRLEKILVPQTSIERKE
jgi:S1-C subfamily serine protease